MRFRRFVVLAASLAVFGCGLNVPATHAQEAQRPIAIVSISPLDRLLQDTTYLLKACNVPEVGGLVSIMANQYTQGLDRTKPIGMSVTLNGPMPVATIFIPLSNRDQFFGALAGMGIEPDDLGDGLFEINAGGQTLFAKHAGGWMTIAQSEEALAKVPADPSQALGTLPQQYNLAVSLNVQALPPDLKEMATQQMRIGLERGMAEQRGLSEEELAKAKELSEANIQQLEQMISDTEKVIIGWNVDSAQQRVNIDLAAQFVAGSKLAGSVAVMQDLTSDFTKLAFPGAAAHFRFTSKLAEEDKAAQILNLRNSMAQIESQVPEADQAAAKEILAGLTKIMEETIQEGIFDGASSVSLADDTLRAVLGGHIADGKALEAELKLVASKLSGKSNAPEFKFNTGDYKGISLHSVKFDVKSDDRVAQRLFGDSIVISVGTGAKSFFLSLDPSGEAALKAAIDRVQSTAGAKVAPVDGIIELAQILRFAQSISPNPMVDNALQTIQQYAGKDKAAIAGRMIERGFMYRFSVEEGVLRAAGAAAKAGNGNGGF